MMGIEHIALQTDDYASAIAKLRSNGAHVMLEQVNNGRHVAFIEAPDGAQMELIEKVYVALRSSRRRPDPVSRVPACSRRRD